MNPAVQCSALCAHTHTKILHMNAHMRILYLWASAPFQMLTAYHNRAPNTLIRAPCFHRLFGKLDSSRPTTVLTTKNAFGKSKRCIAPVAAWHAQQLLLLLSINPVDGSTSIWVLHQGTGSWQLSNPIIHRVAPMHIQNWMSSLIPSYSAAHHDHLQQQHHQHHNHICHQIHLDPLPKS